MTANIAIVGTGWGVRIQVPAFRQVGLNIVGLWGRTEEKAQKLAKELNIPFATADYKALLDQANADLISITTPPMSHAEMSILALQAGKHVLCEKPTALNASEVEKMVAAAQTYPKQIALIDHELRFAPTRQKMHSLVQAGYVGDVLHADACVLAGWLLNPNRTWNWWSDLAQGGGLLGAIGSHIVDQLIWLLDRRVTAVNGHQRTFIKERPDQTGQTRLVTSDDYALLQLQLGEISAQVQMSGVTTGPGVGRVHIVGTKGSLLYENERLMGYQLAADGRTTEPEDFTVAENISLPPDYPNTDFPRATLYIGEALKVALENNDHSPLKPAATFADGLHIQRVLDAARESNAKKEWVTLD